MPAFFPKTRALAILVILIVWAPAARAQTIYLYQRGYVAGGTQAATQLTDQAITAFARRHPEIEVVPVGLPWSREGDLKLRAVLLNRRKVDCFRATNDQLPDFIPARGELLSPIDSFLTATDREDISRGALEALTHGGKVMAWPLWSTALAILGNRDIMHERGIKPPGDGNPWGWDEFLAALAAGTFERPDGREVWGLTAAAKPPLFEWNPLLWAHTGPILETTIEGEREPGLHFAPNLVQALGKLAELRKRRLVSPSFGIDDQPASQAQFLEGRATFILSSPAFIRSLSARKFPYLILPPPIGDLGRPITTGALGCFAVVAHPEEPERTRAAHLLANYLTSTEVASDVPGWFLAAPVRKSIKVFADDPSYAGLDEIARSAVYMNTPGGAAFLERTLIPSLQAALIGELAPERVEAEILKSWERSRLR